MDLNSDLGESYGAWTMGDDAAMLAIVSSAPTSPAASTPATPTILRRPREAAARGVCRSGPMSPIRDRVGFGRRPWTWRRAELTADVIYQIGALQGLATAAGTRVRYVKPHGALYNTIAARRRAGRRGHRRHPGGRPVAGPAWASPARRSSSAPARPACSVVAEAFADRAYTPDGHARLAPRGRARCCTTRELVAARMLRLATDGTLEAIDGSTLQARRADRSACMATAPAPWRWPGASAAPSRLTASPIRSSLIG